MEMANMISHKKIANLLRGQYYILVEKNWIGLKWFKLY